MSFKDFCRDAREIFHISPTPNIEYDIVPSSGSHEFNVGPDGNVRYHVAIPDAVTTALISNGQFSTISLVASGTSNLEVRGKKFILPSTEDSFEITDLWTKTFGGGASGLKEGDAAFDRLSGHLYAILIGAGITNGLYRFNPLDGTLINSAAVPGNNQRRFIEVDRLGRIWLVNERFGANLYNTDLEDTGISYNGGTEGSNFVSGFSVGFDWDVLINYSTNGGYRRTLLDSDGAQIWTILPDAYSLISFGDSFVHYDGVVLTAPNDGRLLLLNKSDAAVIWNISSNGDIAGVAVDGHILVIEGTGTNPILRKRHRSNGEIVWSRALASSGGTTPALTKLMVSDDGRIITYQGQIGAFLMTANDGTAIPRTSGSPEGGTGVGVHPLNNAHILSRSTDPQVSLSVPKNFTATKTAETTIKLDWDEAAGADGYNIYLKKDSGSFTKHNTSVITPTDYTITGVEIGVYEVYAVSVFDGEESLPSNNKSFQFLLYHSMSLNGSDQYLTLTTLGNFGSGLANCTWEVWFKTAITNKEMALAAVANDGVTTSIQSRVNINTSGGAEPGSLSHYIRDDASGQKASAHNNNAGFNDGEWHKVAFRITGVTTLDIFIDGVKQSLSSTGGSPADNFTNFDKFMALGARHNNASVVDRFFEGKLALPAFYNVAKSDTFLQDDWDKVPDSEDPDLQALYLLDEGSGNVAADGSGNGFDATLVGNAGDNMWDDDLPSISV